MWKVVLIPFVLLGSLFGRFQMTVPTCPDLAPSFPSQVIILSVSGLMPPFAHTPAGTY